MLSDRLIVAYEDQIVAYQVGQLYMIWNPWLRLGMLRKS